jgi:hypothetical protein
LLLASKMYSIPQTLLSGQTLLSKRCYDPQFLVVFYQADMCCEPKPATPDLVVCSHELARTRDVALFLGDYEYTVDCNAAIQIVRQEAATSRTYQSRYVQQGSSTSPGRTSE